MKSIFLRIIKLVINEDGLHSICNGYFKTKAIIREQLAEQSEAIFTGRQERGTGGTVFLL